jgi:SH3 domain protein
LSSKFLLALLCLCAPLQLFAQTRYIVDELTVPLRRGASNQHRIIHAGLPSGTVLEVIGEDTAAGFSQVRMQNGTEGWVPSQYLTAEPIAKDRLAAALRRVETLTSELANVRQTMKSEQTARGSAQSTVGELEKQVRQLQEQLEEMRRVSATPMAQFEENKALKAQNADLQKTTLDQAQRIKALESNELQGWLLIGGGLVIVGFIFGVIIKSRPKTKSGW